MTYDDAGWHTDSTFELGLDESAAATHIGIFLSWAATRGLLSPDDAAIAATVLRRESTPAQIADDTFDGQIDPSMLSPIGQRFVDETYNDYLTAIESVAAAAGMDQVYRLPNTWDTYDAVAPLIDSIYERWVV